MTTLPAITMQEKITLAKAITDSGFFGIRTPAQALSLMLIAEAEGMHPAAAARDYHIIEGRPALKADAMLARFLMSGGKVEWHSYTDELVSATFSHPAGGSVTVDWDIARVKQAGLITQKRQMFIKFPRQMLRARVLSEGVRTVAPGCVAGFYTPEEVRDFVDEDAQPKPAPKNVTPTATPAPASHSWAEIADDIKTSVALAQSNAEIDAVIKSSKQDLCAMKTEATALYWDICARTKAQRSMLADGPEKTEEEPFEQSDAYKAKAADWAAANAQPAAA